MPRHLRKVGDQSIHLQCKRQVRRLRIGEQEIVTGRVLTVPSSRQSVELCNWRACGPTRRPVPSFSFFFLGLDVGEGLGSLLVACAATSTSAKPASSSSSSILVFLFLLITASPKVARRALASLRSFSRFDFSEVRVARGPAQREGYECFLDGHCINVC